MNRSVLKMLEAEVPRLPVPIKQQMSVEEIARHLTLHPDHVQAVLDKYELIVNGLRLARAAWLPRVVRAAEMSADKVMEILTLAGRLTPPKRP